MSRLRLSLALVGIVSLIIGPPMAQSAEHRLIVEAGSAGVTVTQGTITLSDGRRVATDAADRFVVVGAASVMVEGDARDNHLVVTGRGDLEGGTLILDSGPVIEVEAGSLTFAGGGGFDVLEIRGHSDGLPRLTSQNPAMSSRADLAAQTAGIAQGQVSVVFLGDGDDEMRVTAADPQPYAYHSVACGRPKCGIVEMGSELTAWFEGLAPITFSGAGGPLTVDATGTPTTFLTVADDLTDQAGVGGNQVTGDGGWETVSFAGFGSFTLRSGTGDETITLASLDTAGTLTQVNLDGADTAGTDTGNDVINVIPLPISLVVAGGPHTTGDTMVVDGLGNFAIDTGSAVQISGFADILYSEIETVTLTNLPVELLRFSVD